MPLLLSRIDKRSINANAPPIGRCAGTTDAYTALGGVIDSAEHLSAVDKVALYGLGRMDHGLGTAIIEFGAGQSLTIERF